ncbi:MAG: outer membrane protein assembly factor BamD [Gallionellaceae bacterium]|nr:outer membrane protein assembly factor BamD [Gallionellaceae bacterium]
MRHSLALILLFTLTACNMFSPLPEGMPTTTSNKPVNELYADAMDEMKDEHYETAIKTFEQLQSRYPYGRYAQQAQLEIAYAYYKQKDADSALAAADRFIKQYPNNPHVDYAYYLKGLTNFNEDLGLLGELVKRDLSERDPRAGRDSFDAFKELVTRFPDSKYAPDSRLRMQYLINALAQNEIHVASYYLRRGAYVAAVNRAKGILSDFPQTPQTRDALQIMVQAYDAMGMKELRDDAQRVLDKNTTKSDMALASPYSLKNRKSWWQFWEEEKATPAAIPQQKNAEPPPKEEKSWWQLWK